MDPYARLRAPVVWDGLVAGADHCAHGAWWEAHESWEDAWRAYRERDRSVLQGLIQLAAVNWHLARGRGDAARQVLARAIHRLHEADPSHAWPFALGRVRGDALVLRDRLARTHGSLPPLPLAHLAAELRRAPHPV